MTRREACDTLTKLARSRILSHDALTFVQNLRDEICMGNYEPKAVSSTLMEMADWTFLSNEVAGDLMTMSKMVKSNAWEKCNGTAGRFKCGDCEFLVGDE